MWLIDSLCWYVPGFEISIEISIEMIEMLLDDELSVPIPRNNQVRIVECFHLIQNAYIVFCLLVV